MTQREKTLIIGGVLLLAAVIVFFTFIGKRKDSDVWKEIIKAKDETIEAERRGRETERQWKEYAIQELRTKDSLLQVKIKTNIVRYEKIPVIVGNLSDEELRSAVENYR